MCSETASPRISYSLDTVSTVPTELNRHGSLSSYSSDPNHDFDFGVVFAGHIEHQVCSAEELFANGTIVPVHMRSDLSSHGITVHCECTDEEEEEEEEEEDVQPDLPFLSSDPADENNAADQARENSLHDVTERNVKAEKKCQSTKSFWGFSRSSSLNSDDGNKVSLLCPLPDLSRSRSVSCVAGNPNKMQQQQKQQRQRSTCVSEMGKSSSSIAAYVCPFPHISHSMKKSNNGRGGSQYGNNDSTSSRNSIRVSPILNVPPHKGSVGNFFGLGCFYIRGKDKKTTT